MTTSVRSMNLLRALLSGLGILVLAFMNGGVRESFLVYRLGRALAFAMSGIALSLLIFAVALRTIRWIGGNGRGWRIGVLWVVLALLFEWGFGLVIQHRTVQDMLQAYRFEEGNLWPVVLLSLLLAPPLAARLRGPRARPDREVA